MSLSAASENFGFGSLAKSLQVDNSTHKDKQNTFWSYEHGGLMKHAHIHRPEYGFPAKHLR